MTEGVRGRMLGTQGNHEDEDNDDVFVECEPVVVHEVPDRSGYRSSGSMDSTSSETSPFGRTNMDFCITSSSTTNRSRIHHQRHFQEERQQLEDLTGNNRDSKFLTEAIHSEKEFFDYLMSLPTVETTSSSPTRCRRPNTTNNAPDTTDNNDVPTGTSGNPKVGLDHLDHLCKLMEQLGDLRKKNVKLQKRVQYLEELRTLNELRKELRDAVQSSLLAHPQTRVNTAISTPASANKQTASRSFSDTKHRQHHSVRIALQEQLQDEQQEEEVSSRERQSRSRHQAEDTAWYGSDETLLDKDTGPTSTTKDSAKAYARLRRSLMRRRTRSKSVGNVEIEGRSSAGMKSKISRWTKVREALKWERAQVGHHQAGAAFYVEVSPLQTPTSNSSSPNVISVPGLGAGGSGSSPASSTAGGVGDSGVCLSEDGVSTLAQQQHQPLQPRTSTSPERELTLMSLGLHPMDDGDLLLAKYLEENALLDSSSDESAHGDENDRFEGEGRDQMCSLIDSEDTTAVMTRRQSSPLRAYMSREPLVDNEPGRKGKSLDRDVVPRMLAKFAQSEKEKKSHKGAWGRVKNIIQTRKDSLKRKQRKTNTPNENDNADEEEASSDGHIRPISSAEAEVEEEEDEDDMQGISKTKLTVKVKRSRPGPIAINVVSSEAVEAPRKSTRGGSSPKKTPDCEGNTACYPPMDDTVLCSASTYSPPTQHRKSKWTRMKHALLSKREVEEEGVECRTQSVPSSPTVAVAFSYDDLALMDDDDAPTIIARKGSQSNSNLAERSAQLERNLAELQRNLSEDFSRKLEEWEHKRCGSKRSSSTTLVSSSSSSGVHQHRAGSPSKPTERMPALSTNLKTPSSRKGKSEQRDTKDAKTGKQREKELQWLEKQLQKVEREKQRLAKERQKYLEREARLERLRESVITSSASGKGAPKEVLVKTAAGEFRFAGISRTFTRKLYEWEEMKGIGPEVSTIALLDPNYRSGGPGGQEQIQDDINAVPCPLSTLQDTLQPPATTFGGRLDRNRSRSESSLVDLANVQTSTTSLVGIRGRDDEDEDYEDDELFSRMGAQSRATSEPDISTIGVEAKPRLTPPCAIEVEEMHIEEMSPCVEIPEVSVEEPVYSYAPPEVTRISAMEVEIATERTLCSDTNNGAQASYSSLIDENMELMKKLRDKEEICQKLEKDLENIETKSKLKLNQQQNNSHQEGLRSQAHNEDIEMVEDNHTVQREALEKVLRQQRTEQEDIAQRLVEKLSELQSTQLINPLLPPQIRASTDKATLEPPQSSTAISPGVQKIQELSGDLCIQAKKLEQALVERNTTIRNLRWELLKRDMNVKPNSQSQNAPAEYTKPVLQRGTHSRMWSSVDAVLMSDMGKEVKLSAVNAKPKNTAYRALRTVDSVELEYLPQQITGKVQDLKDELARLWSSLGMSMGEAAQPAIEESVTKKQDEGLKDKEPPKNELIVSGKENMKPISRELTARRLSDTCVTSDEKPTEPEAISLAKPVRKFAPNKPKPPIVDKKPLDNAIAIDNESSSESANEESAGVTMNLRANVSKSPQIPIGLRSPSRVPRSLSTPSKPARFSKAAPDASPTAPWRKPRLAASCDADPAIAPAILTPAQSPPPPWRNRNVKVDNVMDKDMGQQSPISKSKSARQLKPPTKTSASCDNNYSPTSPPTPPARSKPSFPKQIRVPGKDPAPNIKLMIEKFNQKVEVASQDSRNVSKSLSAGSSESKIPFFSGGFVTRGLKAEDCPEGAIQKSVSFSSALPNQHNNTAVPASPNQRQSRDTVRKSESAGSFPTKTASPRSIRAPSCGPPPSPGTLSRIPRPSGPPPSDLAKATVTIPEVVIAITTKTIPGPPPVTPREDSNNPGNASRAWQLKKAREEFLSRIPSPSTDRKGPLPQTDSTNNPTEVIKPALPLRKESLKRIPSDKIRKPKDPDKIAKGILKTWRCSFPKGNETNADGIENEHQCFNRSDNDDGEEEEKEFSLPSGLLKSASAGMIDKETSAAIFKRMSSQMSETSTTSTASGEDVGGITLTTDRQLQQHHKSGIFGFRFRKCKLKKKDSDPLPAVKALCRQSLFVDLSATSGQESQHQQPEARSCPSSPELKTRQRGKARWFTKSKGLFRGK